MIVVLILVFAAAVGIDGGVLLWYHILLFGNVHDTAIGRVIVICYLSFVICHLSSVLCYCHWHCHWHRHCHCHCHYRMCVIGSVYVWLVYVVIVIVY